MKRKLIVLAVVLVLFIALLSACTNSSYYGSGSSYCLSSSYTDENVNITRYSLNLSVENVENFVKFFETEVSSCSGQIKTRNVNKGEYGNASYTVLVPVDKVNLFIESVKTNEKVKEINTENENTIDVSSKVQDYLDEKEVLEERLATLIEKRNACEDDATSWLAFDNEIFEINKEIREISKNVSSINNKVEYSKVEVYFSQGDNYDLYDTDIIFGIIFSVLIVLSVITLIILVIVFGIKYSKTKAELKKYKDAVRKRIENQA